MAWMLDWETLCNPARPLSEELPIQVHTPMPSKNKIRSHAQFSRDPKEHHSQLFILDVAFKPTEYFLQKCYRYGRNVIAINTVIPRIAVMMAAVMSTTLAIY